MLWLAVTAGSARLVLAAVFGVAGVAKLRDRAGSIAAASNFGVPTSLSPVVGVGLPVAELLIAAALLVDAVAWWGAVTATLLLVVFIVAIAWNVARGRRPNCHCFGQLHSAPAGFPTMVRNGVLVVLAGSIVAVGRGDAQVVARQRALEAISAHLGSVLLGVTLAAGAGCVMLLLLNVLRQQGRLLTRIEALEQALAARSGAPAVAPLPAPPPAAGLPVGMPAPELILPSLSGDRVSLRSLLTDGRPRVLVFMDPHCGPCTALIPQLAAWRRAHTASLEFVGITRGDAATNRGKFRAAGDLVVLRQDGSEASDAYQSAGTPTAVVVRADGRIGSPVAAGGEAIGQLVTALIERSSVPVGARLGRDAALHRVLPTIAGGETSLAAFAGRETVVLFWNPGCGFCAQMQSSLATWQSTMAADAPQLVVVSTGAPEAHRDLTVRAPVLLDAAFEIGAALGAGGTPSAVLLDMHGEPASDVVAGAEAVLALLAPNLAHPAIQDPAVAPA